MVCGLLLIASISAFAAPSVEFITSQGNFTVELYPEKAPKTVANFLQYVKDGFYENTIFQPTVIYNRTFIYENEGKKISIPLEEIFEALSLTSQK